MSIVFQDRAGRRSHLARYLCEVREIRKSGSGANGSSVNRPADAFESMASHRLVEANLGFVVQIARRYVGRGVPVEDLISEGNLGLLEAASHFDPTRGAKFITYAVWWIRKSMLRAIIEQSSSVRLPHTQRKKIHAVLDATRRLTGELGRNPNRDEIAARLRTSTRRIDKALKVKIQEVSLDHPVSAGSDARASDSLADASATDPEDPLISGERRAMVRRALLDLCERERMVLTERFGLDDDRARTLRELGARLGMSREAIRLIEKRATKKLRRIVERQWTAHVLRHTRREGGSVCLSFGGRHASRPSMLPRRTA